MKITSKLFVFALYALIGSHVFATQLVEADETKQLKVNISQKELSRISIDGGRIVNIRFLDGELDVQKDEVSGQVYVKALTKRVVNLFVTGDSGKTYLLVLQPTTNQADSIVIQERAQQQQLQARAISQPQAVTSKNDAYIRSLKQVVISIANEATDGIGLRFSPSYQEIPLWGEVLFIQVGTYIAADIMAEKYVLTNVTNNALNIAEQEFYKRGVLGVAINKHILQPGESTNIIVIKSVVGS